MKHLSDILYYIYICYLDFFWEFQATMIFILPCVFFLPPFKLLSYLPESHPLRCMTSLIIITHIIYYIHTDTPYWVHFSFCLYIPLLFNRGHLLPVALHLGIKVSMNFSLFSLACQLVISCMHGLFWQSYCWNFSVIALLYLEYNIYQ